MTDKYDFSIVTPSFNGLSYLKLCSASIADQQGASFEHIVVDGGSSDGTSEWLKTQNRIKSVSEKDEGMYDAINKGVKMASGSIIAYLNCDEQYLPETLTYVKDFFEQHPEASVVFGDALLVRPNGSLIGHRKSYSPKLPYILSSHLYILSCTMFFRRQVFDDGNFFDKQFRDLGDTAFVVRLLQRRYRFLHFKKYLSVFTMTGSNMSIGRNALLEQQRMRSETPRWIRTLAHPLNIARLTEKALSRAYWQKYPIHYDIYTLLNTSIRNHFSSHHATFRWKTA